MWANASFEPLSRSAVTVVPMPASFGLAATSSERSEFAVWISSARTVPASPA